MAHVYIYSGAAGAGTGADWTNAYTTHTAATAAKAAGDAFWMAHDHAEVISGSATPVFPGTQSNINTMICVNRAGSVPPVAADYRTTATITTTGGGNYVANGFAYIRGISFIPSGDINIFGWTAASGFVLQNCSLTMTKAGTGEWYFNTESPGISSFVTLIDCTFKFGATSQYIRCRSGRLDIQGGSLDAAGSIPTSLIQIAEGGLIKIRGMDLSAVAANTLVGAVGQGGNFDIVFDGCKIGASTVISGTQTAQGNIYLNNCDSGATNYRNEKWNYLGSQVAETTIVRTGGATDGTTPVSTKIVTTANSTWVSPYEAMSLSVWNDTTGSPVTVTVSGIWGGGAAPNNDDIWIEVGYMASGSSPIITIDRSNTKATYSTANAAQATDAGSTWGGSTTKFKMSVTVTPGMKGPIKVYPKAAAASSTFYIDGKPVLS